MARVVEIRVHGVGGTPPEHLLGMASPDDVVRIGGSGESAFFRRTADTSGDVEGYAWGALTSRAFLQPLWIFLLPFTLANAAGWMIPAPDRARRFFFWTFARRCVYAFGALLTAGYALCISVIVVKQVFYQWGATWSFLGLDESPKVRVFLGGLVSAAIGVLFAWTARRTQRGFEGVNGPFGKPRSPDDVHFWQLKVGGARRVEIDQSLEDEEFWSRARRARTLLNAHWAVWMLAVAVFTVVSMANAGPLTPGDEPPLPHLDVVPLFAGLGAAQLVVLVTLLATLWAGFRTPMSTSYFRYFGPCIAFSTAIALTAGFFSALATLTGHTIQGFSSKNELLGLDGPEYDLDVAFGAGSGTFLVAVLILVGLRLRDGGRIAREIDETNVPPVNDAGSYAWPKGIPDQKVGGVAKARAFSLAIRKADWVLSVPALPFAFLGTWTLMSMFGWLQPPKEADCFGKANCLMWLNGLGGWITGAAVAALLATLLRGYFKESQRRTIGIVWDVLTFWPRRFHPLAVRPYAERAVPELQCRIVDHLQRDPKSSLILSVHSQGTILAYAALVQLAKYRPDLAKRISLVTYGSPLSRLHSAFFPGYFDPAAFARLAGKLCPGTVQVNGDALPMGWRNFYRLTDYIGQRVEFEPAPQDVNVEVPDPPETEPDEDPAYFERPDPLRA
ncbi:MAG: hypothetical protein M3271_03485, partial [Actinomycetota bacterium]|nr:hypothetical protein [Actinomycetota bacterium]